ncbi:MAG: stage III sporulation protein AB [Ruminococcus sp.]|nr:stage III sporulation protein AB [Ruminococcus sp.]
MFKLILCIVIILCSTLVGFSYSSKLFERKRVLESFVLELKNAKTRMRYSSNELYKIFENNFMKYSFCENIPFINQWDDMLKGYSKLLTKQDFKLLYDFGKTLGTTDLNGEISNIDMYITLLDKQILHSQKCIDSKSGVYKTLGLSLGLAVAIILI